MPPNHVRVPPLHHTPTYLKLLQMRTKSEETESAIIVVRGVTMLINAPTRKPKKRREYIQKIEDGMTRIWMTIMWRIGLLKMEVMIESLS
jgi:hypothetical protein